MSWPVSAFSNAPAALREILAASPALRQAYLVGGCVRDALLDLPQKDFDVEVFGVGYPELAAELSRYGRADLVGRSFGVIKLTVPAGDTYDFSLPRRDSKTGPGHKGFGIDFDPAITPREAASRRDFTINSLMLDPRSGELLDFFGGRRDLEDRVLRHTSPAFVEDPLRVLRGMQFAARFALTAAPETVALCQAIKTSCRELPPERIREEWWKWAVKSARPSLGLQFLEETGWIENFPELAALRGVPQDPEWHPEGDVLTHTRHCCDSLVALPAWQNADEESRGVYHFAVLAHDFGKALTTVAEQRGDRLRIVSPGHESASVPLAESFLARVDLPISLRKRVGPLVACHMVPNQPFSDRAIRRLAHRLKPENIQGLCVVMTADASGRPPRPAAAPPIVAHLLARAADLQVAESAPKPILMGRHLIALGLPPGKNLGELLEAAYDAQLEGSFETLDSALDWLANTRAASLPPDTAAKLRDRENNSPRVPLRPPAESND
jgi:tRNA nucleotidyltransferase (CCA-adding enzyme)